MIYVLLSLIYVLLSVSDVKAWATANMLRLNDSKTELMLVTSKRSKHLHNLALINHRFLFVRVFLSFFLLG